MKYAPSYTTLLACFASMYTECPPRASNEPNHQHRIHITNHRAQRIAQRYRQHSAPYLIRSGRPGFSTLIRLTPQTLYEQLRNAIQQANMDHFDHLIRNGADVNSCDSDNMTMLHWAIGTSSISIIKKLLDAGALVNAQTLLGNTPLHFAVHECANLRDVELLLAAGANPDIHNKHHLSPRDLAQKCNNSELLKLFNYYTVNR